MPVIKTGTETGSIAACAGQPSASPDLQEFTVSGANLTGNITVTSPLGFEISLAAGGGYSNSLVLSQSGGTVNNKQIYVRSSAADAAGSLAGNVLLTAAGATTIKVPVTGTVFALPTVNPVAPQTVNNGAPTKAVNFTGTGNIFTWTNDTPGIGLAAGGTGNIASFKAINTGVSPVTATITVTPSPAGFAYIPDSQGNVTVINTATNAVVTTIHVGNELFGVTVSPDNSKVYITNEGGHSELISNIAVINTQTNEVVSTIDVDLGPIGLALNSDGSRAYVVNSTEQDFQVVNTITQTVLSTLTLGDGPFELAVRANGNTVYVGNVDYNYIWVINTLTNQVTGEIPVDQRPSDLILSPDGTRLYVANIQSGNVSVINTSTNTVITTINTGGAETLPLSSPWGMTFSPDGSKLYVANYTLNTVMVINTASNLVATSIPVGNGPVGTSVTADGSRLYVVNYTDGTVSVINTTTNKVITTVPVGANPWSVGNFISAGTGCAGAPIKFTITINPDPLFVPTIVAGAVTGSIVACPNEASASPNIQQFTVAGGKLTGNITVTAPAGFEISLSAAGGFGASVTLSPVAGLVNNTVIYARSAASATTGSISGPVVISSPGAVSQNVIVNGNIAAPVDPSVSIAVSANNICAGTPVTFTATPTNGGSTPVYQWQVNGNNAGTNSATFSSSSLTNGEVVTCVIISSAACAVPATATSNLITMVVDPVVTPSVSIAATATAICVGTPVTFTAAPTNGGSNPGFQWQLNGSNTGTNSPEFTSSTLANGDVVNCMMTINAACIAPANAISNNITMMVNPLPVVSAGGNKSIYKGSSTVLDGTSTGNIAGINWSPSIGLSNNKILTPVASPTTTTTYILTVETTSGCVSMDSVNVDVTIPPLVIPNTFTPNGDGINDTWDIKYLNFYPDCTVQVFTRWGQKVYSSIGYPSPWDGRLGGSALPMGTYYYIIGLGNNSKLLSGYVVIIR
jgi:gliding motility-associated-like protein